MFNLNQQVRITKHDSMSVGEVGTIIKIYDHNDNDACYVYEVQIENRYLQVSDSEIESI